MKRTQWRIGLLTVLGFAGLSTQLFAQAQWAELHGKGFALRGQLSARTLNAVACDLETAVKVLRRSTADGDAPQVVAVDNARDIREWLPEFNARGRGNPLGAYWRGLYGDHIVVRVDAPPAERLRRVLHEYAHFVTHMAHREPAPWLDEGVSELWEHAAIMGGTIEVGRPVADHLKRLRSQKDWISVRELLAANVIPTRTNAASAMFYAESWALVHYLMFEKHGGQISIERLADPPDFPTDAELRAYVKRPMGGGVTIRTASVADECSGKTINNDVSPIESLLQRAGALADGERPEAALPLLQAVLVLDTNNAQAIETIGFVYFRQNRPVEAASMFDDLIGTGRASHVSYYYRAILAGPVPKTSRGGEPIPQVEYLQKALALKPGFAPALQRLRELTGGLLPSPPDCETVNPRL